MGWMRWGGVVAGILGVVFLYIASSPWLVWYSQPPTSQRLLIFSSVVPATVVGTTAQNFTSLITRWQYVFAHSSAAAWQATLYTLLARPVPLAPAALLYTEEWFPEPTIIMATQRRGDIKFITLPADTRNPLASPLSGGNDYVNPTHYSLPTTHFDAGLALVVPGSSLKALPPALREAWNTLLRTHLGFTHTQPDIIAAVAEYGRVVVSVSERETSIGIVARQSGLPGRQAGGQAADEEAATWTKTIEGWAVDEDRFRRPVERAFRLPDGTLGREIVAGLPGAVWNSSDSERCRTPLPEKPALWSCARDTHHVLANYYWPGSDTIPAESAWEIFIGSDFLTAVPGIMTLHAWGNDSGAAGVIELVGSE